jgi:hypothetical protein
MNTTNKIEQEILEFFDDQGCAAITTNDLSQEITRSYEDVYIGLKGLHSKGLMWSSAPCLWKPVSIPSVALKDLEAIDQ